MQIDILSIIRQTWKETVHQSYDGKIWWHEDDVVAIFYSLLKPIIDKMENYELFWNWGIKFPNENVKTVDLALVRIEKRGKNLSGYQMIAMEFKYPWFLKDSLKRIANDITKLTRLMKEDLVDYLPSEKDNLGIINKGCNPDHVFLFVIYGGEEKTESFNFYDQFRDNPVEILVAYPDD